MSFIKNISFSNSDVHKTDFCLAVSYNQPKLDAYATWCANAITFASAATAGALPFGIFVNTNNTVYVADQANGRIQIWSNNTANPTKTISGNLSYPLSIFVTVNGDIYSGNSYLNHRIDKWMLNAHTSVSLMNVISSCFGLFVDINDNLYCSMSTRHQVIRTSFTNAPDMFSIVAGKGCFGNTSAMLNSPYGIFVDINLALYVADCGNNRIQLFQSNEFSAMTVAGYESLNITITLNCPTGVVLDADKYLFIVDSYNHRIVGSGPNGFRCLVGCIGSGGSVSNQLLYPWSLSFDSYGNLFVSDRNNNRIQKFILLNNTAGKYYGLVVTD